MTTSSSYLCEFLWFTGGGIIENIDPTSDVFILTILREVEDVDKWKKNFFDLITNLKSNYPDKKIYLILNSWFTPHINKLDLTGVDEVLTVDFFLMLVYDRLFNKHESVPADKWCLNSNKFLFLTGKPFKIQRIRLLYKFYKAGLLNNVEWSLFNNSRVDLEFVKKSLLPELSIDEIKNFIQQHLRNPDQAEIIINRQNFHYSGIPFDTKLYNDCIFQVISETSYSQLLGPWITEKGWLPIVNRRPFIVAGDPGYLQRLNNLGFKTFENYLKNPNYGNIDNDELRLDAIVDNAQTWLLTIHSQYDNISKDVEHNFQRFVELARVNFDKMNDFIKRHNITDATIDSMLNLRDEISHAQFKNWYRRIKDPKWPLCDREEDFFKLPDWIQKECIEVFNYKPRGE